MLGMLQIIAVLITLAAFAKMAIKTKADSFTLNVPLLIGGVISAVILSVFMSSFGTIGAGERGIVLRWGAVTGRTVEPGLYLVTPLIESVHKVNVQVQKETTKALAVSKTIQSVATEVALNYSISPALVGRLYANVGEDFKTRIIDPAIQEAVKAVTAQYDTENLIAQRHIVKENLTADLKARLEPLGILVEAVSITDFQFTPEFSQAIEQKMTATQQALRAQNDLKRVEFEAQQRVAQAEGEAKAIQIQAAAIQSQGGAEYVRLKAIEKWNGALPTNMYAGTPVPFINIAK